MQSHTATDRPGLDYFPSRKSGKVPSHDTVTKTPTTNWQKPIEKQHLERVGNNTFIFCTASCLLSSDNTQVSFTIVVRLPT